MTTGLEIELQAGQKCAVTIGKRAEPGEVIAVSGEHILIRCGGFKYFRAPDDIAFTAEQVADKLGLAKRTVSAMVRSGEMPGRKIGHKTIIGRAAFEDWLGGGAVTRGKAKGRRIANSVSAARGRRN